MTKLYFLKILNYEIGFSKEVFKVLSGYFKVNKVAFNKPYTLIDSYEKVFKKNQKHSFSTKGN